MLESPTLKRFKTLIENNRIIHYYDYTGPKNKATEVGKYLSKKLDGEYIIVTSASKNTIHIVISYPLMAENINDNSALT